MTRPTQVTLSPVKIPGESNLNSNSNSGSRPSAEARYFWENEDEVIVIAERIVQDSRAPSKTQEYVIRYRGRLLGAYRTKGRTAGPSAFRVVARELSRRHGSHFDPEQLDLCRMVPVKLDKSKALEDTQSDDQFDWFGGA